MKSRMEHDDEVRQARGHWSQGWKVRIARSHQNRFAFRRGEANAAFGRGGSDHCAENRQRFSIGIADNLRNAKFIKTIIEALVNAREVNRVIGPRRSRHGTAVIVAERTIGEAALLGPAGETSAI